LISETQSNGRIIIQGGIKFVGGAQQMGVRQFERDDGVVVSPGRKKVVGGIPPKRNHAEIAVAVQNVRSDLEVTMNVRLRDIEEAQQRIVNTIRRLEELGELITNKGGKDDIVV